MYYCLKWLNDGNFFRTREAETGLGKSTIHEDTVHVLEALVEGLDDQLQWPDADKRQELASVFPGMFHGCVGIADVKEYQVVKYLDPVKEKRSWSGKKKINSYKLLSVMDHSGRYIYAWFVQERMTMRFLQVAPFTCPKVIIFQMMNLLLLMVLLRVTVT